MDDMNFNDNIDKNINPDNANQEKASANPNDGPAADMYGDTKENQENLMPKVWDDFNEIDSNLDSEGRKNGTINIQSVPVKRKWIRKAIPFIACIVVSALIGGIAGGAYTNYLISKDKNYDTPITISQSGSSNQAYQAAYTPPSSLIAKIASDTGPSVVGVDTELVSQGFFGQKQVAQGSGSGIIFDKRGYIVTNQHVIDGGQKIYVTLPGKQKLTAQLVGQDKISDIAVLKVDRDNLPVAKFGDSSKVRVGDLAIAIGNPLGEEYAGTVTSGIISALNRTIDIDEGEYSRRYKLIQTDAAINPGNSGGALINENGEVIGINSIKFADSEIEGMGFAIPINDVKTIVDQLLKNGYVSRPYLGVSVVTITEKMASQYKCPAGVGVYTVQRGSAAEAAGLKPNDVILEIDGVKLSTNEELINELQKHKVGDSVKLKIWRDGSNLTISITLGEDKGSTN